jgi:uncharacterized protein DUF6152
VTSTNTKIIRLFRFAASARHVLPLAGLAVLLMAGAKASAHHSFAAEYDGNKPITLTGAISKMLWSNPHAWIYVDVKSADGKVVNWAFETGGANALYRRGWKKTDLPVGEKVTIEGFLARDGSTHVNATNIKLPDGRQLFAGSSGTGSPGKPASQP